LSSSGLSSSLVLDPRCIIPTLPLSTPTLPIPHIFVHPGTPDIAHRLPSSASAPTLSTRIVPAPRSPPPTILATISVAGLDTTLAPPASRMLPRLSQSQPVISASLGSNTETAMGVSSESSPSAQ
jgi:hypothetical protein